MEPDVAGTALAPLGTEPAAAATRPARLFWELVHDLAVALLFCFFLVGFVAQPFRVQGSSMQPLLTDGERILVNKLAYRLHGVERGDVVVFWWPRDPNVSFIKRVVARPGDVVEIRRGTVYVNARPVPEGYLMPQYRDEDDLPAREVPPGYYFVLGDHRNASNDSRTWGDVPERYIYGKAAFRFWPLGRWGRLQ